MAGSLAECRYHRPSINRLERVSVEASLPGALGLAPIFLPEGIDVRLGCGSSVVGVEEGKLSVIDGEERFDRRVAVPAIVLSAPPAHLLSHVGCHCAEGLGVCLGGAQFGSTHGPRPLPVNGGTMLFHGNPVGAQLGLREQLPRARLAMSGLLASMLTPNII